MTRHLNVSIFQVIFRFANGNLFALAHFECKPMQTNPQSDNNGLSEEEKLFNCTLFVFFAKILNFKQKAFNKC